MGRKKLQTKQKKNTFSLSQEAQVIIDGERNKSKYVTEAIIEKSVKPLNK